jgi:hypothetical protein
VDPFTYAALLEHQARERAYRRADRDPELAWLIEEELNRSAVRVDLAPVRRALRTAVLAILGLF